ncbi:MAG: hypothetical protein DPW09_44490, partial [Anaerolineae bacterium]|nr:hypothetical protein [Anaerolineae bacterium]
MKIDRSLLRIIALLAVAWSFIQLVPPSLALTQEPVTPTEAMRVANEDYEAGNYADAASIYEAIIASGLHNSNVYYNLGNAYFKQEDLGRAILNYRRAQRLDPRDADTTAN